MEGLQGGAGAGRFGFIGISLEEEGGFAGQGGGGGFETSI